MFLSLCSSIKNILILYNGRMRMMIQNYLNKFIPKLVYSTYSKIKRKVYQTGWFEVKNDGVVSRIPTVGYDFVFISKV